MKYNFLIEQNKEYQDLYKEYNEILNEKKEKLKKVNNETVENLELESLDYTQLKELIDLISYNIDDKLKEKLNKAYLSKKPYTNKVVEKMDFLDKDRKIQLDVNLSYFRNKYIISNFWFKLRVEEDTKQQIIDILLQEDIIRKEYQIRCPKCYDNIGILRERNLNDLKEFISIKEQISQHEKRSSNRDLTEEERIKLEDLYSKYYDIEESENPLTHYCDRCDYENEFDSPDELFKYCKEIYYIK